MVVTEFGQVVGPLSEHRLNYNKYMHKQQDLPVSVRVK